MAERDEREILSEIELAKKHLREDLSRKEKEAEARLDELLSSKKTQFCSRCGKKISSRKEWRGHCLHTGCESLLCNTCWLVEKSRFCRDHFIDIVGDEREAKQKIFFKKEPTPIKTLLTEEPDKINDKRKEKIENLTNTYIDLLKDRLSRSFPDFTQEEFLEKAKAKATIGDTEMDVVINKKSFLKEEPKLKILVRALYGKEKSDIEFAIEKLKQQEVYSIFILVGDELTKEAVNHVDKFNNPGFSVILSLPTQNLLYPDAKKLTRLYSRWFERTTSLKELLKSVADDVDGRKVVSAEAASELLGFSEDETFRFLGTCKFLEPVPDTNSFLFV